MFRRLGKHQKAASDGPPVTAATNFSLLSHLSSTFFLLFRRSSNLSSNECAESFICQQGLSIAARFLTVSSLSQPEEYEYRGVLIESTRRTRIQGQIYCRSLQPTRLPAYWFSMLHRNSIDCTPVFIRGMGSMYLSEARCRL